MKLIIKVLLIFIVFPIFLGLEVIGTLFLYASTWLEAVGALMLANDIKEVMETHDGLVSALEKKAETFGLIIRTEIKHRAEELGCLDEIVEDLDNIKQQ